MLPTGLLIALLASAAVSAATSPALGPAASATAPDDALHVAVPMLPPWSFHGPDCRLNGIAVTNLRRLAARADIPVRFVPMPLESSEDRLLEAGIDLFLSDPTLNGPLTRSIALPFGYSIETVAIGPAVSDGRPPPDRPGLRVGARTTALAARTGFRSATVLTGDMGAVLAPALVRGDLDVVAGGRESGVFALLLQGVTPKTIKAQTAATGRYEVAYRMFPDGDARWGARLRAAAAAMDWPASDRQLRQRFLGPEQVRAARDAQTGCGSDGFRS